MAQAGTLQQLDNDADLALALKHLAREDAAFRSALKECGYPALRRRDAGFAGLAAIVTGQQLSVASARAIWDRMETGLGAVTAERLRVTSDEKLQSFGQSRSKIRTLRALCEAVADGSLDLQATARMPNDDVFAMLTSVKGIGPWTADVFLLFCLGRADAWPAGDLALMEGIRILRDLPERPKGEDCIRQADCWRPYRGAAAHLLWALYAARKRRAGVPDVQT